MSNVTHNAHQCLLRALGGPSTPPAPTTTAAVCLTGQLRGVHIAAVNLWQTVLSALSANLFYVGPADDWYNDPHGAPVLRLLPGFVAERVYGPRLRFGRWPSRMEMLYLQERLLVLGKCSETHAKRPRCRRLPELRINLHTLPHRYSGDARALRVLLQLLQQQECLGLVQRHERKSGSAYQLLVRLRPDAFVGVTVPPTAMRSAAFPVVNRNCCNDTCPTAEQVAASIARKEPPRMRRCWPHSYQDQFFFGSRAAMAHAFRFLPVLTPPPPPPAPLTLTPPPPPPPPRLPGARRAKRPKPRSVDCSAADVACRISAAHRRRFFARRDLDLYHALERHVGEQLGEGALGDGPVVVTGMFRLNRARRCFRVQIDTDNIRHAVVRSEGALRAEGGPLAAAIAAAERCFGYTYTPDCPLEDGVGDLWFRDTLTDAELGPWLGQPAALLTQPGESGGVVGHCGVTGAATPGSCDGARNDGSWALAQVGVSTLDGCVAYCKRHCGARCRYVSFSAHRAHRDCSWYSRCEQLQMSDHGDTYRTRLVHASPPGPADAGGGPLPRRRGRGGAAKARGGDSHNRRGVARSSWHGTQRPLGRAAV